MSYMALIVFASLQFFEGMYGTRECGVHVIKTQNEEAIDRVLKFEGDLDDQQRARLADIAVRTPVTLTLKRGVPIRTSLE